jgi:ACR3 family arsenite transporter
MTPEQAEQYLAGAILLGAAPCTAMVFVWSYLTRGDANYTLVQVSVNDLILLVAFVPIVGLLFSVFDIKIDGVLGVPYTTLFSSVVLFVVIPLVTGYLVNRWLIKSKGKDWFEGVFLKKLKPVSILALLLTLILIFAFQGETILKEPIMILLIAVPLTVQTYFHLFCQLVYRQVFKAKTRHLRSGVYDRREQFL